MYPGSSSPPLGPPPYGGSNQGGPPLSGTSSTGMSSSSSRSSSVSSLHSTGGFCMGGSMAGDPDFSVEATNEDATSCKMSAVSRGYYKDNFIKHFWPRKPERKAPEIHLGYYTRVAGIQLLLEKVCLTLGKPVQVVNLGCGFDSLYWRLRDKNNPETPIKNFIEIDFPGVTAKKIAAIRKSKELLSLIIQDEDSDVEMSPTDLHGHSYHLISADFTRLDETLAAKLAACHLNYSLPTIFLAECVLVYIDPVQVSNFLSWVNEKFSIPIFINHEQLNMNDRFGQVMVSNLRSRGCDLPGLDACIDHRAQCDRFLRCGFSGSRCWSMNEIYGELPRDEISRVEKIEHLDERELMAQLFEHYCISISWKNPSWGNVHIDWDDVDWFN